MSNAILLVEDTASDEKLTLRMFKRSNLQNEVLVVRDGSEALDYLLGKNHVDEFKELPALVLLDLNLPRVSGMEVLRRVRADERAKHLPIVILTASKEEEDIVNGYALGANAYVRKPVEFSAFTEAARTLGLFWLLSSEPMPTLLTPSHGA
jgi:two-component system response regulator